MSYNSKFKDSSKTGFKNIKQDDLNPSLSDSIKTPENIDSASQTWQTGKGSVSNARTSSRGSKPRRQISNTPWIDTRMSALREIKALTWYIEPTKQATEAATSYKIINGLNSIKTTSFTGRENLTGNVISRLVTLRNSAMNENFDSVSYPIELNYMFLNYETGGNSPTANNLYYSQAVVEALADTHSNILTELLFSTSVGTTTMAGLSDNRVAALIHYQTFCQNLALIQTKYNQTMLLTNQLVNMGYNAESPITEELYSLFKKAAFIARLKAVSKYLMSKYFDFSWQRNFSSITDTPSRKSESLREPLLTTRCVYKMPTVQLFATDASGNQTGNAWYDSETMKTSVTYKNWDGNTVTLNDVKMDKIVKDIITLLDQNTILRWARNRFAGQGNSVTPQEYFNSINKLITALCAVTDKFVAQSVDIEVFLDRAKTSGLCQWQKGATFEPVMQSGPVSYNAIIHDILRAYLATPSKIKWSDTIQAWMYATLWDEFNGIAKYDLNSGGSYLSFSVRSVDYTGLDVNDPILMVPKLFSVAANPDVVNRLGSSAVISYDEMTPNQIKEHPIMARLIPYQDMSNDIYTLRIPKLDLSSIPTTEYSRMSAAYLLMQQLFGYGKVIVGTGKNQTTNQAISNTLMCEIDCTMENMSADMLNFLRANAPLRVYNEATSRKIGMDFKE